MHGSTTSRDTELASTRLRHLRYTYTYDAAGRLASVDIRRHTGSMSCGTTTGGTAVLGTGSFTYQQNTGNRDFANSGYNQDDQLLSEGVTGAVRYYTYDGRGRLIDRAGNLPMAFGWDTMGHLRSTTTAGATTSYRYDPAGRLIAIDNPGTDEDEYFVYRNGLEPVAWTRGEVHQYYVYASMPHVPDLIYEDSDADPEIDTIYRVITDERGSVRSVLRLGETIEVAQMVEYTAWGEPTYLHGDAHIQPFGFAGATWLPQARLWHMGAREYDPRLGRWISKDPIRFAGGTNLYVYCEGDPVNWIDRTGGKRESIGIIDGIIQSLAIGHNAVVQGRAEGNPNYYSYISRTQVQHPTGFNGLGGRALTAVGFAGADEITYQACPPGAPTEVQRNAQHYAEAYQSVENGWPAPLELILVGMWLGVKGEALTPLSPVLFDQPYDSPPTLGDAVASTMGALEAPDPITGTSYFDLVGTGPGRLLWAGLW